ncbi:pathogenesis-related protein 1-like [Tasmannia lanceolata]|uniref:pathogenesis-related protein 1-like n=1 Tax=Tasmannia lanceolata TaxID=3420 RepID=UPI0040640551
MGEIGLSFEMKCMVSATRMFQASVIDSHNFMPKFFSRVIKSGEIIGGNGGVGSVKHFKCTEVAPFTHVKERVDLLDKDNFEFRYTVIKGADIGTKLISSVTHLKFEHCGETECLVKVSVKLHPMHGVKYTEEEIQLKILGMYKIVEGHLLSKPEIYPECFYNTIQLL